MKKHPNLKHKQALESYHKYLQRIKNNEWPLYDFSNTYYLNDSTHLHIICTKHGKFKILPYNFTRGSSCPKCARENEKKLKTKTTSEYKEELLLNGGDFELIGKYQGAIQTSTHKHLNCGNIFEAYPANVKRNSCAYCSTSGFNKATPAILYYLKVTHNDTVAYKIGITNRSVKDRFNNMELKHIEILKIWKYKLGADAKDKESDILQNNSDFLYKGPDLLSSGNTELFSTDILNLDT